MPYKTGTWGEQAKARAKRRWLEYRLVVLGKLGGKCVKCGNDDYRVLQIDHVDGKGCQERKKLGYNNNYYVVQSIIKGERKKYQLLCANCNWIKRWENNECKREEV
jgi:predicted nucleic-acid-binding Zn-ribbon protein